MICTENWQYSNHNILVYTTCKNLKQWNRSWSTLSYNPHIMCLMFCYNIYIHSLTLGFYCQIPPLLSYSLSQLLPPILYKHYLLCASTRFSFVTKIDIVIVQIGMQTLNIKINYLFKCWQLFWRKVSGFSACSSQLVVWWVSGEFPSGNNI